MEPRPPRIHRPNRFDASGPVAAYHHAPPEAPTQDQRLRDSPERLAFALS